MQIQCHVCEWGPFAVTEDGRLVQHATPLGERCGGGGSSPPVRFRKVARAWIGNRHQGRGTAMWAAYVGDVEVGSWADGSGTAWGLTRPLSGYRQWRQIMTGRIGVQDEGEGWRSATFD